MIRRRFALGQKYLLKSDFFNHPLTISGVCWPYKHKKIKGRQMRLGLVIMTGFFLGIAISFTLATVFSAEAAPTMAEKVVAQASR